MTSWNMYVVEDLEGAKVNEYKYEVNYMPESIVPFTVTENKNNLEGVEIHILILNISAAVYRSLIVKQ